MPEDGRRVPKGASVHYWGTDIRDLGQTKHARSHCGPLYHWKTRRSWPLMHPQILDNAAIGEMLTRHT
jgi:hypothetical protein